MPTSTVYGSRLANLRALRDKHGPSELATMLGHTNGSFLSQLAGPRPSRKISEKVARDIEEKLRLPEGWMDQEHKPKEQPPPAKGALDESRLAQAVRSVVSAVRTAAVNLNDETFAEMVTLVYEHQQLVGKIDEPYVQRLVKLAGRG